jgi:hypothetical protein
LDTAFGVRSKDSNRPFVPIKQGQNDITAKAISSWICSTVMLAYKAVAWNEGNDNRKYYPTNFCQGGRIKNTPR